MYSVVCAPVCVYSVCVQEGVWGAICMYMYQGVIRVPMWSMRGVCDVCMCVVCLLCVYGV